MAVEGAAFLMLCDQGLTDAARIIGLRLAALGDEWHEMRPDDFAKMVAGYPKQETVAKHLRQLEVAGYIERKAGGRGHADKFRFAFSLEEKSGSKSVVIPFRSGKKSLEPENTSDLKALVVEGEDEVKPPISPLSDLLDPKALEVVQKNDEKLKGCRGSLCDYLRARVPFVRQYAYAQTIVGWMDDIDPTVWRKVNGGWLEKERRTQVLATALNELAASDESKMKRPVGDVANLKTKINFLMGQQDGSRRNYTRATGTEGKGQADQSARRQRGYDSE